MAIPSEIRRVPYYPAIHRDKIAGNAPVLAEAFDAQPQPSIEPLNARSVAAAQATGDAAASGLASSIEQSSEAVAMPLLTNEKPLASSITPTLPHWKWELFCALVSSASSIAIIILLRANQGEVVLRWKSIISINSYVAILTAVFKGAVAVPLLAIESCQHTLSIVASLPRVNAPVVGLDGPKGVGVLRGHILKPDMAKAFLAGICTSPANSSVAIAVSCATGN